MKTSFLKLLLIGASSILVFAQAQAKDVDIVVDCDKSKEDNYVLNKYLNVAKAGSIVAVTGECTDIALVISNSGATLEGPAVLRGIGTEPVIRVEDSGNVALTNLSLTQGSQGLELSSARVNATNVDSSFNNETGFSVVQKSALVCTDCTGSNNGVRGLLSSGTVTLCGENEFNGNPTDGILLFQSGGLFSDRDICGGPSSITASNNVTGLSLFQNASFYANAARLSVNGNTTGIAAQHSSAMQLINSAFFANDNDGPGLFINSGTTVRLNVEPANPSAELSIQGNLIGVVLQQNSQFVASGANITGNLTGVSASVYGFSIATLFAGTSEPTDCQPGKSSGNLCP